MPALPLCVISGAIEPIPSGTGGADDLVLQRKEGEELQLVVPDALPVRIEGCTGRNLRPELVASAVQGDASGSQVVEDGSSAHQNSSQFVPLRATTPRSSPVRVVRIVRFGSESPPLCGVSF